MITVEEWAEALDAEMRESGLARYDYVSHGYANGALAGVALEFEDPRANDERGIIVGEGGLVVAWDPGSGHWTPTCLGRG